MDNVEKLRLLLQHWMDHNDGHVEEFEKWRTTMNNEGQQELADHIGEAVAAMAEVNEKLAKALEKGGGPVQGGDSHHHHHHHH